MLTTGHCAEFVTTPGQVMTAPKLQSTEPHAFNNEQYRVH